MKNKLLILDKDGTLVKPASGGKWVTSPEDQELLPGVAEAIARYCADGWGLAIASNQGGVAAGHKTLDDCIKELQYAMKISGIQLAIAAHTFEKDCGEAIVVHGQEESHFFTIADGKHRYRKPEPGMICRLVEEYPSAASILQWHKENCLMVGDRPEDEGAAIAAGVRFMWADEWRANSGELVQVST